MPDSPETAQICAAIDEAAGLLDVTCSREKVRPIVAAYQDALAQSVIAFRVATGSRNAGELDCRFTMLPRTLDPYGTAVSHGLLTDTGHPSDSLLSEMHRHLPVDCYGIDFGVVGGFKKTWTFMPPDDLQDMTTLAGLPSMPRSLAENTDFLARHGLADKGSLIGIDHKSRTVNVYFGEPPAECFEKRTIRSMLRELGLPAPSDRMLSLGERAFGIYTTLSWDSPRVERITFAVMTPDPTTLPIRLDPAVEHFVKSAPTMDPPDDRRFVYAVTSGPGGEYDKLQSYYRWRPRMLGLMLLDTPETSPAQQSSPPER